MMKEIAVEMKHMYITRMLNLSSIIIINDKFNYLLEHVHWEQYHTKVVDDENTF